MKKNFIYSMLAIASMGFALGACSNEDVVDVLSATHAPITRAAEDVVTPAEGFGYHEVDFLAGQNMLAGKISVWNDYANVYVKFATTGNWVIKKTHLYVGSKEVLLDPANGYVNKKGDVAPGKLPIKEDFKKPYQTELIYTIPFAELIGYEGIEWPVVNAPENYDEAKAAYDWILEHEICPVVAAHAEVCELIYNDETGEWVEKNGQTAWGDGINFVTGDKKGNGSWSMYFDGNCVEFPEPVIPEEPEPDPIEPAEPTYEYSYVNSNTGWACILDDGMEFASNNWADFVKYEGGEKVVNIYAGNPKNNAEMKVAGTVTIAPAEGNNVTITIGVEKEEVPENDSKWFLTPGDKDNVMINYYNSDPTNESSAPGKFPVKANDQYVFTVPAAQFYAIHLEVSQLKVTEVLPEVAE